MLGQNNDVILRIDSLSKSFSNYKSAGSLEDSKGKLQVIKDVSFDVKDGEFLTIIGPSGCGKSTLLSLIAGLDKYDSGQVIVNGHRVSSSGPDIIMIFQEDALFPWLTVEQNVEFGLKQQGLSKREREIAFLLSRGLRNKEISDKMFISEYTVENHLRSIYRKMNVTNRTGVVHCLLEMSQNRSNV